MVPFLAFVGCFLIIPTVTVVVAAFLAGRMPFGRIAEVIDVVLAAHTVTPADSLDAVRAADAWARRRADEVLES